MVHLLNAMGIRVPVRIKLGTRAASDGAAMCHVVQVRQEAYVRQLPYGAVPSP